MEGQRIKKELAWTWSELMAVYSIASTESTGARVLFTFGLLDVMI